MTTARSQAAGILQTAAPYSDAELDTLRQALSEAENLSENESNHAAMQREISDALDAVRYSVDEARHVLETNELHHMEGDRAELMARVKRFCELSKRYQEND